ncbi:MAG: hypothetical protein A2Z47_14340 [Thermodesulfovibrio sp. RBG_19FT_COMBO_42_12]|nr:MAG: hypothetical protein A2Z47_14340 [Thermodesulfovibrio sp. RBG_19FT_COMBO_42_12]
MFTSIPVVKKIIRNYLKNKYEKFPKLISIEITSACNAKCVMCPRDQLTRKIQHMPLEVFDKIIYDCKDRPLKKINLFWFGDPLCNPNVIYYLEKIRKELPKIKIYVSTNAELLDQNKSDEIIKRNLIDVINFDIDGINKETYEKIRIGVDFERVFKNVHYFIDKRRRLHNKKPQIRATIIKMNGTANEIDEFKSYWSKHVDKVDVNDYNTWLGNKEDNNIGSALEKSQHGCFKYPCIHPWTELVFSADGIAGLCCLDYNLTARLGSVLDKSVEEIWKGKALDKYRQRMINLEYEKINCCKRCNAYIYQDGKTWAKLWG